MTAVVPTRVQTIDSRVDLAYGTSGQKQYKIVVVEVTTTATSNTMNLDTYVDGGVDGIAGVLMNSVDGATSSTAMTWSTTTVTFANYAGSGVVIAAFLVY